MIEVANPRPGTNVAFGQLSGQRVDVRSAAEKATFAPRPPFIVGIGHKARVGKDTAASALQANLGFVRRGFADPLKALALECDPIVTPGQAMMNKLDNTRLQWILTGVGGWEKAKDSYPEVRKFLQNLGVGARKVFGENFWIDMAFKNLGPEPVVFSDVRFINEAQAIRSQGGVVIDIVRAVPPTVAHVSETELDGYDFDEIFINDKGVAELQADVVAWVKNRMETGAVPKGKDGE